MSRSKLPGRVGAVALLGAVTATSAHADFLDPSCANALQRLGSEEEVDVADLSGQTTGTVAMLGNLLCFVQDPRCACLRDVIDSGSDARADFVEELSSRLAGCGSSAPDRSLSGVVQEAALAVCPDELEPASVTVFDVSALSGFVIEGSAAVANASPTLGDDALDEEIRAILTFPLDDLPPGAQVDRATLRVNEEGVEGEPFALGRVVVDHIDSGGTFDPEIFDGFDLESPIGGAATPVVLSEGPPLGEKSIDVTAQVRLDVLAGRTTSQYRVRFDPGGSDGDGANDDLFLGQGRLELDFRAAP